MKKANVAGLSGGRSSLFMVRQLIDHGYDPVILFADTGFEAPGTYDFIRDAVKHWGIKINCIRAVVGSKGVGNTYEEITVDEIGYRPKTFIDHFAKYGTCTINAKNCTDRLKGIIMDKWKNDRFGRDGYTTWIGIRADEQRRLKEQEQQLDAISDRLNKPIKTNIRYLANISDKSKSEIIDWWSHQDFDLTVDEWSGNCMFCIHKSPEKLAMAARDNQEAAKDWIEMVKSDSVAVMGRNEWLGTDIQYRGYHSLESIIKTFSDTPTDILKEHLIKGKRFASGSCSSSCEPTPQMSLLLDD